MISSRRLLTTRRSNSGKLLQRTESVKEQGGKGAEMEETNSVEELRQAVADETLYPVLQWQKSMVKLATDLSATFSQRSTPSD